MRQVFPTIYQDYDGRQWVSLDDLATLRRVDPIEVLSQVANGQDDDRIEVADHTGRSRLVTLADLDSCAGLFVTAADSQHLLNFALT